MTRSNVVAVQPPPESAISDWYANPDLLGSFAIRLPPDAPCDARLLARRMLETLPAWVRMLMALRDVVMSKAGVATSSDLRAATEGKDRIGFFPVVYHAQKEIVLGYEDQHLDFRTSILIVYETDGNLLISTTAVRCHNLLGRIYIRTIQPFHVAIVRNGLRRSAAKP